MEIMTLDETNEQASDLANDIYFLVMDHVNKEKYVEPDPDSEDGGTRNTPKGRELYYDIEDFLMGKTSRGNMYWFTNE